MRDIWSQRLIGAAVLLCLCILIHTGALLLSLRQTGAEDYIYSTRGGFGVRTSKSTGKVEVSGPEGWHEVSSARNLPDTPAMSSETRR